MEILSIPSFVACFFSFLLSEKNDVDIRNSEKDFEKFIKLFPENESPFSVSIEDFNYDRTYRKDIVQEAWSLEKTYLDDIQYARMSRIGTPTIEPIQYFKIDDNMLVFIYSIHYYDYDFFAQKNLNEKASVNSSKVYKCATLNEKGDFLNDYMLAYNTCQETKISSVNKGGIIKTTMLENDCQQSIAMYGLSSTENIVGRKKKETTFFKINKKGLFEELKESSTTARASL